MKEYSWKSVALRSGLVAFAKTNGIEGKDSRNREEPENFATMVLAKTREDISNNGCDWAETTTKTGKVKAIEATRKDGSYKATGTGAKEQLVYSGEKHGVLLCKCSFLTRALVKQDEVFADLESRGYGVSFLPATGSETEYLLKRQVESFKASRISRAAKESAEITPEVPVAPLPAQEIAVAVAATV